MTRPHRTSPQTLIRQPSALIGATAVELLLAEADAGPGFVHQRVVYRPELVVRASTTR